MVTSLNDISSFYVASLDKWKDDGEKAKGLLHEDCDVGTMVQDKTWSFLSTRVALLTQAYSSSLEVCYLHLYVYLMSKI